MCGGGFLGFFIKYAYIFVSKWSMYVDNYDVGDLF